MKQCPVCKTTYTGESLRFCLADGTSLETIFDEEPTVVRPNQPTRRSGLWWKVLLGLIALVFVGTAVLGLAGLVFFYNSAGTNSNVAVRKSPTPKPSASPTPDTEKQRLQEELANLQKKLNEQKTSPANTKPFPETREPGHVYAKVNSPNDGFLALRSEPDTEYGEQLFKIPHGAEVELSNCEKEQETISGRVGRWCLVTYKDYAGYVFDAWLEY